MNKLISFIFVMACFFYPTMVGACDPPSFLLFQEDAQTKLYYLNQSPSINNLFERITLMHNLSFHGNEDLRERAEKSLGDNFKKKKYTPLVEAYDGSLRIINVKHRGAISKIFGSPKKDVRKAFDKITNALKDDPGNMNIRFIRASAAVEVSEHIPELLEYANEDLLWMEANLDWSDSAMVFFFNLTMAKYYYKEAKNEEKLLSKRGFLNNSIEYICLAYDVACNEVYSREQNHWEDKIFSLEIE